MDSETLWMLVGSRVQTHFLYNNILTKEEFEKIKLKALETKTTSNKPKTMSEVIDPEDCKWYLNRKGVLGCFLHPLSNNTPSHCTNSEAYPCERLKEDQEIEVIKNEKKKKN
jgi:hypothetical protein